MSYIISILTSQSDFSVYFVGVLYILLGASIVCLNKNNRERYYTFWLSLSFSLIGVAYFFDFINGIFFTEKAWLLSALLQLLAIYSLLEFLILNSADFFNFKLTRFLQIPSLLVSISILLTFKSLIIGFGSIYLSILYFVTSVAIYRKLRNSTAISESRNDIYIACSFLLSASIFLKALPISSPSISNGIIITSHLFVVASFLHIFCLFALSLIIVTENIYSELKNEDLTNNQMRFYMATPFLTILLVVCINLVAGEFERYVLKNERDKLVARVNDSAANIVNLIDSRITFAKTASSIVAASPAIENFFINPDEYNKKQLYKVLTAFFKNYPDGFCYLLNKQGIVTASSKNEDILLGRNFSFRPYFKDAIAGNPGVLIAVGRSTNIVGFYSSRPVINSSTGEILGVCCVKRNLNDLNKQFQKNALAMLIDDSNNIFFSSNESLLNKKFIPPIDSSRLHIDNTELQLNKNMFSFSSKKYVFKMLPISLPNWNVVTIKSTYSLAISRIYTAISFLILSIAFIIFLISQARSKEALVRYKNTQARFKSIFELAPEAITIISSQTLQIASANTSFKKMLGFSEDEEMIDVDFTTLISDDASILKQFDDILLEDNEIKHEQVFRKKNGETFTAEVISTKIVIDNEHFFLLFLRDISLQKETEANLQESKRAAEEASALKSRFLANTSHELRTPMTAIIGLTEIVKSQIKSERLTEILSLIQDSAKSLLDMLNDVLNLSQIEAGKVLPEPEAFDLHESIEKIVLTSKWKAEKKGLSVKKSVSKDIPEMLIGDFKKIRQILMNLIDNAIKFTKKGSILISANMGVDDTANPVLEFSVADTGVGMSREKQDDLFKSFLQAEPYLISEQKGSGLGLLIAKKLVDLLKGKMSVESCVNRGTTVHFSIPITVPSSDRLPESVQIENVKLKRNGVPLEILIADDNEINLLLARFTIEQYDGLPYGVRDGLEVLDVLERKKFDLILLDIQMPRLDGIATIEMIRNSKHSKYKDLPVIAVSAFADDDKILKNSNINAFLQKPYSRQELISKIITVLPFELDREAETNIQNNNLKISMQDKDGLELKQIDVKELELRILKKPENIKRIQSIFKERSSTLLRELKENADDIDKLAVTIHSIKGLCGMLAARKPFDNSRKIESYIKDKKMHNLRPLITLLEQQITEIAEDLLHITEHIDKLSNTSEL